MSFTGNIFKEKIEFKLLFIILIVSLFWGISSINVEAANKGSELSKEQIETLEELGFSKEMAPNVPLTEYNLYYKNLNAVEEPITDTKYYKVVENDLDLSNPMSVYEYNEQDALIEMEKEQNLITTYASDTEKTNWLSMTLTSTKLSNGRTLLKNEFLWLKIPNVTMTDGVGITYGGGAVSYKDTFNFSYIATDGNGNVTYNKQKDFTPGVYGVVARYNLKTISGKGHRGYLSVQVERKGSDTKNNAYGHYTHTTVGITGTIGIKTGEISLGWAAKETKMPNTMITFSY